VKGYVRCPRCEELMYHAEAVCWICKAEMAGGDTLCMVGDNGKIIAYSLPQSVVDLTRDRFGFIDIPADKLRGIILGQRERG